MSQSAESLHAALAGVCYPKDPEEILGFFKSWFTAAKLPLKSEKAHKPNPHFLGIIAPHIDFRVTKTAYAHAYTHLTTAPVAETYIILGVGHRAHQEWSCDLRDFVTPLGTVKADKKKLQVFLDKVSTRLAANPEAYIHEHSIEFPLICLQAWRKLNGIDAPFTYVPLLCGGLAEALFLKSPPPPLSALYALAKVLKQLVESSGGKTQLIVSIDGCHIGPRFGHDYPVNPSVLKDCEKWETALWKQAAKADLNDFLSYLMDDGNLRYFDGVGALGLVLAAFGPALKLKTTHYEQWFEARDTSAVTFSSGLLELKKAH